MDGAKQTIPLSSCDACESNFWCGKLETALEVLNSMKQRGSFEDKDLTAIEAVIEELKQSGWAFPDAEQPCSLAADKGRVAELTDKLIVALDHTRRTR